MSALRVEVSTVDLGPPVDDGVLDASERARADRFRSDAARRRFVATRVALRRVLADHLGADPAGLRFVEGVHGKPALTEHQREFSVSHSGDVAMIAVVLDDAAVGVDIEVHRDVDHEALARRFFSPTEVAVLDALATEVRATAFFRCWTAKEAYLKGLGLGLSLPLSSFDVTVDLDQPAALLASRQRPDDVDRWALLDLPAPGAASASLAVESAGRPVELVLRP